MPRTATRTATAPEHPADPSAEESLRAGELALHGSGDLVASRRAFAAAHAAAEQSRDAGALARAALGMGGIWVHERRAPAEAATVEACQRAALAQPNLDAALTLRLQVRLAAEADYRTGRCDQVPALLDQARALQDPIALAEALSLTHHCLLGPADGVRRQALAEELLRVASTTGRSGDTVMALLWRTVDLFLAGDRQAERAFADLRDHPAVARHAAASFVADSMRVMLTVRAGRLVEAEALAENCARAGAAAGDTDWMGWYAAQLLTVRWFQGRVGELVDTVATVVNSPTLSVVDHSFIAAQAVVCAAAGQTRQARGAVARIVGRDLGELPPSSSWLAAMTAVIEAAVLLDDAASLRRAHDLLAPFGHLPVMASLAVSCLGSARQPLGLACLAMGEIDRAVEHLEAAVVHNAALGHWPAVTLSRHRLAQALGRRGRPGDAREATRMRAEAAAEAAELGMRLPAVVERHRQVTPVGAVCIQSGRRWRVELRGRAAVVEDMVGLHHLAQLVANPGVDIPAVDLAETHHAGSAPAGAPQRIADDETLRRYRARLRQIAEQVERARAAGRDDEAERLQAEARWIAREVDTVTGLGGRPRHFADEGERARIAVGKALRRALARIAAVDADLGAELGACIETGSRCCYRPENG
ncbi:MAG: hypothetical protein U0Q19_14210 [Kineosporiaceae bacterium]